jgi:hypothetical protein
MLRPLADGETKKSDDFSKFLQYEGFLAYVSVKAGSFYGLLKNIRLKTAERR